jgi:TPP-dependent pyruvate/acetoin dehydrogenase alpha subunit
MRPRIQTPWIVSKNVLMESFGLSKDAVDKYDTVSKEDQLKAYEMMQLCRQFETACNQVGVCLEF